MLTLYKLFSLIVYAWYRLIGQGRAKRGEFLWQGRLGPIDDVPSDVWLHAASVGEIRVVSYLVSFLLEKRPDLRIHVTTMTPAGFRTAGDLLGDRVTLTYFPLDAPPSIRRSLDSIAPRVLVIAETEIWPNLITEATQRRIPIVQINGRLSERAFKRYRLIRGPLRSLINSYNRWFLKTDQDAERYHELGLNDDLAEVAGDMKFDAPLRRLEDEQVAQVRTRAGAKADDFLFVAGSTRPGEEVMLAELYTTLSARYDDFRMIIAPRHVERVGEITAELERMNVNRRLFNSKGPSEDDRGSEPALVLVDTVGQLNDIYVAADLAFVGGTLVDLGGHNLLEPVWGQTPVLYGPHIENVREAAEYIEANSLGKRIDNADQLTQTVERVHAGVIKFAVKQETDLTNSATARIGSYLLEILGHA